MAMLKTNIVFIVLAMILPQAVSAAYVLTAPPRETGNDGYKVYGPIADFLTKATGETFEYRQQNNWSQYVKGMRAKNYDLVFDGPHLVDWRIKNIEHHVIVKIPYLLQWQVVTRNESSINKVEDLAGKKVCAQNLPNFGTLNLLSHFKNDQVAPEHVKVKGWKNIYNGVKNGDCVAGILPKKNHQMYDQDKQFTRVIHTHLPFPNQAFTAGERIPEALKDKIRTALLSEAGSQALQNLMQRYTGGTNLVSAVDEEYDTIQGVLLNNEYFIN